MKILIRNLPRTLSENELEELFKVYGEVQSCTLILDKATGESKGFGLLRLQKLATQKQPYKHSTESLLMAIKLESKRQKLVQLNV